MDTDHKAFQLEALSLFEKQSSWREESNRQFSNILNSNSSIINKGINDLVRENSSLRAELSFVKNERSGLLKTVDNLNDEIRQLRPKRKTLPEPEEDLQDIPEASNEIVEVKEQELRRNHVGIKKNDHKMMEYHVEMSDREIQEHNKRPQNEGDTMNVIWHDDDLENEDVHNIEDDPDDPVDWETPKDESDRKEPERDETRVAKDKKKKKEVPLPLKKMYQCDVCNYTNSNKAHLNLHKRNVHRVENKTFICESCPDTFTTWGGLQCHINWKHKFDQKYECNLCPYKAVYRGHLQAHIKKLHKQI